MGGFSLWHWVIVLLIVVILFGRGRISEIMGDFGKGITSFKKGMSDVEKSADAPAAEPAARIEGPTPATGAPVTDEVAATPADPSTRA